MKGPAFTVILGSVCQAGDFTPHGGTGGRSVQGEMRVTLEHMHPGIFSLAEVGPTQTVPAFFGTARPECALGRHVAFGR